MREKEFKGHPAPDDGTYQFTDRNGVAHTLPNGVDYGFDYAPNQSTFKEFASNKAAALPDKLASAFLADTKKVSGVNVDSLLLAKQTQAVTDYLKLYGFKAIEKQLKNKELAQILGLTQAEHSMIHTYTGNGFLDINRLLYGLEPFKDNALPVLQPAAEVLSQALAKLKPYKGRSVRCLSLPKEKLADYRIDAIVKHDAFTSASLSDEDVFINEPIRMIIFSKTGKRIDMFSTKPDEKEVLFDKGTSFKVKDILKTVTNGQSLTIITLQEL